jgi:lysozyme
VTPIAHAIDVSHHQNPNTVPWARIRETSEYAIIRLAYGSGLRDRECVRHFKAARAAGFKVGGYHFFRPSQDPVAQLAVFKAQAEACEYGSGDVIPWLDIEADPVPKPGKSVSPEWFKPALELWNGIREHFGQCGVYITQREWGMLGKPSWVTDSPLWVAHYTKALTPASPNGKQPMMWQWRVGPYDVKGPGGYYESSQLVLDQNRVYEALPLILRQPEPSVAPPPQSQAADDPDWDDLCARAMAAQYDVGGIIASEGIREMSDTEPAPPPTERNS